MKRKLGIIIIATMVMFSCNRKQSGNTLKIGVLGAETGDCSADGKLQRRGATLAAQELGDTAVSIHFFDTHSEQTTEVEMLNKGITVKQIGLFIGDVSSGLTKASIPILSQQKVFLISPWAGAASLSNISPFFCRNYPIGTSEAQYAAKYITKELRGKHIAIVYVNNEWGNSLDHDFKVELLRQNGQVVDEEMCKESETDFRTVITRLKSFHPDAIYMAGYQVDMGYLTKQMREQAFLIPIVANTSYLNASCLAIARNASDGVYVPMPNFDPKHSKIPSVKHFFAVYQQNFPGKVPTLLEANAYDAVMLIYLASKKVGRTPEKVAAYIRNLKQYAGATGIYNFTNGDVDTRIILKQFKNGAPLTVAGL